MTAQLVVLTCLVEPEQADLLAEALVNTSEGLCIKGSGGVATYDLTTPANATIADALRELEHDEAADAVEEAQA